MALKIQDFSVTMPSSGGGITYTYILRVTEERINRADNTSTVTVQAILKQTYSGTAFYSWSTGVSCTVNGQQLFSDYRQRDLRGTGEHVYYTWTGDLPHDPDGKLTLRVTGKLWQVDPESFSPPTMVIPEGTMFLTTIARTSTLGVADAAIGSYTTVLINRADESFYHMITYEFGHLTGYMMADGSIGPGKEFVPDYISFRVPVDFYEAIPDAPWGDCLLTLYTYNGFAGECIGTSTHTFRVFADLTRCGPSVTGTVTDTNGATVALTGDPGVLVRYMSDAHCSVTASAQKSATLESVTVNGRPIEDALTLSGAETDMFVFRAVDSRGHEDTHRVQLPMIPYVRLTCNPTAHRTTPTGGEAVLTVRGNCYQGGFGAEENTLTGRWRIQTNSGGFSSWQPLELTWEEDTYEGQVTLSGLDYTRSYPVEVQVADALETVTVPVTVQRGIPVFDWGRDYFTFHVPVHFDAGATGL